MKKRPTAEEASLEKLRKTLSNGIPHTLSDKVEWLGLDELKLPARELRQHPERQISKIANSISANGFTAPVLTDEHGEVLAGAARLEAARRLGMPAVPVLRLLGLTAAQKRAYRIVDNRSAELASWNEQALGLELLELSSIIELEVTGFDTAESDRYIEVILEAVDDDDAPALALDAVSRLGDLWQIGIHRLFVGDALTAISYQRLLGQLEADMCFSDCPYNVRVAGHVSGLGKVKHREFVMGSGELSATGFLRFLRTYLRHVSAFCKEPAPVYACMDWRSIEALLAAGRKEGLALKNICVWEKSAPALGSYYRSQHELIVFFQSGTGTLRNNIAFGVSGRNRSNVWHYPGANSFGRGRLESLALHPTVKPRALVEDAILDCTKRGDVVLDPFLGSGTTLLAAHKAGRVGVGIELDPLYADVAIRRLEAATGLRARLVATGQTFTEVEASRAPRLALAPPSDGGEEV